MIEEYKDKQRRHSVVFKRMNDLDAGAVAHHFGTVRRFMFDVGVCSLLDYWIAPTYVGFRFE